MKKERVIYYDYLRVFATISVVLLHAAAQNWYSADPRGLDWNIANFYEGLVRWGVPVFLMISGALFLSRDIPTKTLYTKYIARMVAAYAVWSTVYALGIPLVDKLFDPGYQFSRFHMVFTIVTGHFHLWFIPMIVGVYMCIPLIRQIIGSETATRYFMCLSFVFAFVIPQFVAITNDFIGGRVAIVVNMVYEAIDNMKLSMISGFVLYFLLGHLLSQRKLSKKQRYCIYALGVVGAVSTIVLSALVSYRANQASTTYYENTCLNVFFQVLAVFTWFRHGEYHSEKWNRLIVKLSKYSFGVYLVHVFVLSVLQKVGVHTGRFTMLLSIPAIALVTVVISYLISWILNKIPVVRKWIV